MATTTRPRPIKTVALVTGFCDAFAEVSGDVTMGLQQLRLLLALYVHGTLNQNDLTRYTGVAKSSNGRNIDRMGAGSFREAGLGLLESDVDPMDRRFKLVRLTPKGRAVIEEAAGKVAKYLGE